MGKTDDSDFLQAFYSVYKKSGQFFFHTYCQLVKTKMQQFCQVWKIFEQVAKLSIKTMILTFLKTPCI